ncbi:hypothetical protein F5Y19DRAFT_409264 [Xylariaceae sp. FL1651]|nr:hypothetical protein F5Y19DRAFT_409264 [Xylariaceae sp. FL1651]
MAVSTVKGCGRIHVVGRVGRVGLLKSKHRADQSTSSFNLVVAWLGIICVVATNYWSLPLYTVSLIITLYTMLVYHMHYQNILPTN